jgi:hypothetical protein
MTKALAPLGLLALSFALPAAADIPATPVMSLYQFNGARDIPYYSVDGFRAGDPGPAAGTLAQGTSLIPCLVIRGGEPLTDSGGTPYVGFDIVVDARKATGADTDVFKRAFAKRQGLKVRNHHCGPGVRYVIDARKLYSLEKAPFFDPPAGHGSAGAGKGMRGLDAIVRAFHNSGQCADANRRLLGRRDALGSAWAGFARANPGGWSASELDRAKGLDYTMRSALFEGHLERGCNAYGGCERNIVALSIRNRARESCIGRQGCRYPGDFQGVAANVTQYNIWDEYLTEISGLTACYLRDDLVNEPYYAKLQAMYAQNEPDVERILFGDDADLRAVFSGASLADIKDLRHYYHAPAMGKCFPNHDRVEYITGAVARDGSDFALLANARIRVDGKADGGYRFREFRFEALDDRDEVRILDSYPGFVVDARKVDLKPAKGCPPYGIPAGCGFKSVGRYRTVPSWLKQGNPLALSCRIQDRGESCTAAPNGRQVTVGGVCDTQMRPVSGVP